MFNLNLDNFINQIFSKNVEETSNIFQSIFNSFQDLVYVVEVDVEKEVLTYAFINNRAKSYFHPDQEVIGKTFDDILGPSQADFLKNQYLKCAKLMKSVSFEEEAVSADNTIVMGESILTPIQVNNDQIFIIAIVRDVTDKTIKINQLNHSKKLLSENEQRLNNLYTFNEDAIVTLNLEGYFLEVNPAAEKLSGFTNSELIGTQFTELMSKTEADKSMGHLERVVKGERISHDTLIYNKKGQQLNVRITSIPIIIDGKVNSVYVVCKDITKEIKSLEEINKLNAHVESFYKFSNDGFAFINTEGIIEYINQAFTDIFEYQPEEIVGNRPLIIPDWDQNQVNYLLDKVKMGEKIQNYYVKRQKKSGELIDVSLTYSPIYTDEGELTGITSIYRNVTARRNLEESLLKTNEELELIWRLSADPIFFINYNGEIIKVNPAFQSKFGFDSNESQKLSLTDIYLPAQKSQIEYFITKLKESSQAYIFETQRSGKDQNIYDIKATYQPVHKGNMLALVIYEDITAMKQTIGELLDSEERYRSVVENSPEAILIHNAGVITYVNQTAMNLAKAKKKSDIIGKSVLDFVYPKDKVKVTEMLDYRSKHRDTLEVPAMKLLNFERKKLYAEIISVPFRNSITSSGVLLIRDITTKVRAERKIKEIEERFRIIAEHSKDIIEILNPNAKVSFVSPSIDNVLGYHPREIIGQSFGQHIHQDDVQNIQILLQKVNHFKETVTAEMRWIHKEGYSLWLSSDFIPILNDDNEIQNIIVISEDITERKKRETELSQMAYYDHLTGLPNKRLFEDRLSQSIYTSNKTEKLTALLVMDGDNFKCINDRFGHLNGDEVIKEIGYRIKKSIRKKDIVSRVGGDEFVVVLPELENQSEAIQIANRIIKAVNEPMMIASHQIQLGVSVGGAFYPLDALDSRELYSLADFNLYKAKANGGNTIIFNET